jgi:16S rRNA (guanine966-N2)-methyltransferase
MLSVCSGTAKGRILKCPKGTGVRPTSARVRQAIFSALADRVKGSSILDLYAGTGALGIEALSRGAAEAFFVELSPTCVRTIRENLEGAGLVHKATILRGDVMRVLRDLSRQKRKFDLVMADPPYERKAGSGGETSLAEKTLKALGESDILRPNSLVVVEHPRRKTVLEIPEGLKLLSVKKYGDTAVSILCSRLGQSSRCSTNELSLTEPPLRLGLP